MKGIDPSPENGTKNGGIGPELKPDCEPTALNIKVSLGLNQHEVSVPSNSSFGDLKSVIVKKIGLKPEMHKLLFRGKEKEDDEDLQTAGVKDNSKVLLMEDMTCQQQSPEQVKQKSPEQVKENSVISRGGAAVAEVREEVDMISEQVSALQTVVDSGTKVDDKDIIYLTEMLMRQLLKLDGIEAEGEGKVLRKMEVRRVQSFVETMDILKSRNSNPFSNANNAVSVTTQWKTFDGCERVSAGSPIPSSAPTTIPSSTPPSIQYSTLTPAPVPSVPSVPSVPCSTPSPTPVSSVPYPTPTAVPSVPCSTPTSVSSVPYSMPAPAPPPPPVPSSVPAPVPTSVPVLVPSFAPSSMPSSTKITQDWEQFD